MRYSQTYGSQSMLALKILLLAIFAFNFFYWSLPILSAWPVKDPNKGIWFLSVLSLLMISAATIRILRDLRRRLRGETSPPSAVLEVEFAPDGLFHIADGVTGTIKWPTIKSISFEGGIYVLKIEEAGETSETVVTPWVLDGDERLEVENLLLEHLPTPVAAQLSEFLARPTS